MGSDDIQPSKDPRYYRDVAERFVHAIPHGRDLNVQVEEAGYAEVILRMPYQECLLGDVDRGLIHGGVLDSLIDSASGLAVFCALPAMQAVATLDLRIDNMRPGLAGQDIFAWAQCYRMTSQIAFVRAEAYQQRDKPLATSSSAFMRASSNQSFMDKGRAV